MSDDYLKVLLALVICCFISLWVIVFFIASFNDDFNKFRKDYKVMSYKDEEKIPKLNYFAERCFMYLSLMKNSRSIEEFNRYKTEFDKYYNLFLKEKQMLLYFDEKIGG